MRFPRRRLPVAGLPSLVLIGGRAREAAHDSRPSRDCLVAKSIVEFDSYFYEPVIISERIKIKSKLVNGRKLTLPELVRKTPVRDWPSAELLARWTEDSSMQMEPPMEMSLQLSIRFIVHGNAVNQHRAWRERSELGTRFSAAITNSLWTELRPGQKRFCERR